MEDGEKESKVAFGRKKTGFMIPIVEDFNFELFGHGVSIELIRFVLNCINYNLDYFKFEILMFGSF